MSQVKPEVVPYLAPELLKNDVINHSEQADMWGVGILYHRLMFKKLPFPAKTPFELK